MPKPPHSAPGSLRLGPYTLGERLGSGRSAEVYRAQGQGGELAIKVLAAHAELDDPAAAARFRREIAALDAVRHPGVVPLLDHGVDADLGPYLVTPLVHGRTLREVMAQGRVAPPLAAFAAGQLAAALGALHEAGLVHRDVKPENVMLRSDGAVVLIDLGLAWGEAHTRLTEEGEVAGSVPYMAPEQIEGGPLTPATDVWAVGIVMYEWITGERPFFRPRQSEEVAAILSGRYPSLGERDRRVEPALSELVDRCLAPASADRPGGGAELAERLDRLASALARHDLVDPCATSARLDGARAAELAELGHAQLTRGKPFAAAPLLERALAHRPDDPRALALVEELGRTPARKRGAGRVRLLAVATVALALVAALWLPRRWRDAGPSGGDAAGAPAPLPPLPPLPVDGLIPLEASDLAPRLPPPSERTRYVVQAHEWREAIPIQYHGDPYDLVLDRRGTLADRTSDPDLALDYVAALTTTHRTDQALKELDALLERAPQHAPALTLRGRVALRAGELERARALFDRAIAAGDTGLALVERAVLRRLDGDVRGAYEDLVRALTAEPTNADALCELAAVYRQVGRTHDSEPLARFVAEARPDDPDVLLDLAVARGGEVGLAGVDRVLELRPHHRRALRQRCLLLGQAGRLDQLRSACDLAAGMDHEWQDEVLLPAAEAMLAHERHEDASTFALRLSISRPDDPRVHALRARIEAAAGRLDQAEAYWRVACRLGDTEACDQLPADRP